MAGASRKLTLPLSTAKVISFGRSNKNRPALEELWVNL